MPTVAPPVKLEAVEVVAPRPVTVASVSASEVMPDVADDEEIVIVPPVLVIEVEPEPFRVIGPEALLILGTIAAVLRLTVGFCPAETAIPVPALTE